MKKTSTITPEQLAELKRNAAAILAETRMAFTREQPFVGNVSMSLDLIPTRDARNPTAATDGLKLYFDIAFLAKLSPSERMFVIGHEVYHNVMMHFMRQEGRDHQLWNIATDIEVNGILEADGLVPPPDAVTAAKYGFKPQLSAEEYYELLAKKQQSQRTRASGTPNGSADASDAGDNAQQSGNKDGELKGQFDKHVYEGDGSADEPVPEGREDKYGKVGADPDYTPNAKPEAAEKMREAATSAAQAIERERGELPAHLQRLVSKLLEPKVDWKDVLARFVTKHMANDPTWNRPNRRFAANRIYLPGHEGNELNVAVVIDTSGSTVVDSETFLTELNAIVDQHPVYKLTVIHCDTQVNHVDEYSNDMPFYVDEKGYKFHGGGGTRLKPALDYIDVNGIEADVIVVFTDGYCENFTEDMAPNAPVLWLVTEGGVKDNLGFGEVVDFKKAS